MPYTINSTALSLTPPPPVARLSILPSDILLQIISLLHVSPYTLRWGRLHSSSFIRYSTLALVNHRLNNLILFASLDFCFSHSPYDLLSLLMRNMNLGSYVCNVKLSRTLNWGCPYVSWEGKALQWFSEEGFEKAECIIRDVCSSQFWNKEGQEADQAMARRDVVQKRAVEWTKGLKAGKADDEEAAQPMVREDADVVEKRVSGWMRDFKAGETNTFYGFLILLSPNAQVWRKVKQHHYGRDDDVDVDYVAIIHRMARRQEEDAAALVEFTPYEHVKHERRTHNTISPRTATITDYHDHYQRHTFPSAESERNIIETELLRLKLNDNGTLHTEARQPEGENGDDMPYV